VYSYEDNEKQTRNGGKEERKLIPLVGRADENINNSEAMSSRSHGEDLQGSRSHGGDEDG
jgi:hypothetical protein